MSHLRSSKSSNELPTLQSLPTHESLLTESKHPESSNSISYEKAGRSYQLASKHLSSLIMEELDRDFRALGGICSGHDRNAMVRTADVIAGMALSEEPERVVVTPLSPGIGKTRLLRATASVLCLNPDFAGVGMIIFMGSRNEIGEFFQTLDLPKHQVAIVTSEKKLNDLGSGKPATRSC